MEVQGKVQDVFYGRPQLTTWADAPESPGKGLFAEPVTGRTFAVIGTAFYEIFADGTKTNRGTVAVDGYPATISANGDGGAQVLITSGTKGYIFALETNVFTHVVDDVTMAGMMNDFFLGLDITSSTLKISNDLEGLTWQVTQQAQRSAQPDPWKSLVINGQIALLLGSETSEPWYDNGGSPFPFVPVSGAVIPFGIAAPFSAKKVGATVIWLSQTADGIGPVVEAQGYAANRISTHAVETAMQGYSRVDDAVAWTFTWRGHAFYVLNFPEADKTWVYDRTRQAWYEWGSWADGATDYSVWSPQYHAFAFGRHLVLDAAMGTIYELGRGTYTDAGSVIRRERIPSALFQENQRMFLDEFEVLLEPGLGLVTGQGSDPMMALSMSKNGGKTFGEERWRSAGALGDYGLRTRWLRCSSGRQLLPRVVMTDPVNVPVLDAFVKVRVA